MICTSQSSNNATVHCCGCCQVGKVINGCFNKIIICRLCYICIDIPGGSRCFTLHLLVLTVGRCKVDFEVVLSLVLGIYFLPTAAGDVEVACGEDLGVGSGRYAPASLSVPPYSVATTITAYSV
jgi:hypothetical protein